MDRGKPSDLRRGVPIERCLLPWQALTLDPDFFGFEVASLTAGFTAQHYGLRRSSAAALVGLDALDCGFRASMATSIPLLAAQLAGLALVSSRSVC